MASGVGSHGSRAALRVGCHCVNSFNKVVAGRSRTRKNPRPSLTTLKGRECRIALFACAQRERRAIMTHPWCHPACRMCPFHLERNENATTFSRLLRRVETSHLCLLIPVGQHGDFLRPAAHEGVPRGLHHSELPLCFGSLSGATSRTLFAQRGSTCNQFASPSIAVARKKVNPASREIFFSRNVLQWTVYDISKNCIAPVR